MDFDQVCNFFGKVEFLLKNSRKINSRHLDDITLMSQVIDGETEKMSVLYERYKMPLYYYFFKTTSGNREASEDLVHSVFYRVIRYKRDFKGHGSFANWIFRIARNVGLDYKKKTENSNRYYADVTMVKTTEYAENDYEMKEQLDLLDFAMRKLEDDEREIIILGKIECLRYTEIADILGTTEGNVRIRIFRAIKKLKDIFSKIENVHYEEKRSREKSN